MCTKCQGFKDRVKISQPQDLYSLVRQIEIVISEGTLTSVSGNCKLSDIRKGTPWPEDYIKHTFQCSACSQKFMLEVETYHGSGGDWSAIS